MAKAKQAKLTEEERLREQIEELIPEVARLKRVADKQKTPESYKAWAASQGFLEACHQRLAALHQQARDRAAAAARAQRMEQLRPKAQAANALSLALSEAVEELSRASGDGVVVAFPDDPNRRLLSHCPAVIETDTGFEIRSQHPVAELKAKFLRTK